MKFYTIRLQFFCLLLFLPCFVNSISTLAEETEGLYKGFKTLWMPHSQWHFPEIKGRNHSNHTESTTAISRRTTYVTIEWDYKRLFMKDDYDYEGLSPEIVKILKRKMLNRGVTKEFQVVPNHEWRRRDWQFQRSDNEFPEELPSIIPRPKPIPPTVPATRQPKTTWNHPRKWETPQEHKTIIWAWTTTPASALYTTKYDYNYQNYGSDEDFYTFLRRRYAKVGGKTDYPKSLPTVYPIFGTTFVWRFWSYNPQSRQIETYLALETEKQPTTTRRRTTTTLGYVKNTSCYVCGLDLTGIPRQPSCHHVFENEDKRYMFLKNSYKRRCYTGTRGQEPTKKNWYGELYRGGCFKRFTDVGIEFNERGCRTMEPTMGYSFASKRFARLEKTLYDVDDGCVVSPMASLTPFSRAISLYVRYHVCVCKGKYCNQAPTAHTGRILSITRYLSLMIIILSSKNKT